MPGITSVANEFSSFCRCLQRRRPRDLVLVGSLRNGFEGWLKLEFYLWLTAVREPRLKPPTPPAAHGDVGLEHTLHLDGRSFRASRRPRTKRSDMWIRDASSERFHYVEFKALFADCNCSKMITSAASDAWYMSKIRFADDRPATGSAIVLGARFSSVEWGSALDKLRVEACLPQMPVPFHQGTLNNNLTWCILTTVY